MAANQASEVDLVLSGHPRNTDRHPQDPYRTGEFHPALLHIEARLSAQAVSAVPKWELSGLSVHLLEAEAPEFTRAVLEAKDSREEGAAIFQPESAEVPLAEAG